VQLQALEFVAGELAKRIHNERGEFEYLGHRFVRGYKMGCLRAGAVLVVIGSCGHLAGLPILYGIMGNPFIRT